MTSVDAIAVEVVIETTSACPDRARAQAALVDALASARAPKRGGPATTWMVRLGVEDDVRSGAKNKKGTATIIDDRGATVAERTVDDRTACAPLARALGAWAALVLDDELARARDAADAPPSPPAREAKTPAPVTLDRGDWRAPQDPDYVPPATAKPWTLEIGMMGYVRDGLAATTGFAGGSVFASFEVSPGWFVRPAFSYGASALPIALDGKTREAATHIGGRGDFCRRIPGNYIERRGLELDVCLGTDVSQVSAGSQTNTRLGLGPSAAFRGELGANANLELRLVTGYSFMRESLLTEERLPMIYAQAEVGVSWRFR